MVGNEGAKETGRPNSTTKAPRPDDEVILSAPDIRTFAKVVLLERKVRQHSVYLVAWQGWDGSALTGDRLLRWCRHYTSLESAERRYWKEVDAGAPRPPATVVVL